MPFSLMVVDLLMNIQRKQGKQEAISIEQIEYKGAWTVGPFVVAHGH